MKGVKHLNPSPSCMLSGNASFDASTTPAPHPCPVPTDWVVDWSVLNSTAGMSTDPAGFYPPANQPFGLITLDWQSNRETWLVKDDPNKATCEAALSANCVALKKAGTARRCTIYHNMQLSLQWIESNRAVMDQAHIDAGWFLRFTNGSVYDTRTGIRPDPANPHQPDVTFSQYYIDWRNQDSAAYFVAAIVNASFLPGVDGTFTDDSNGAGMEHPTLARDLNITNETLAEIQFATQESGNFLAQTLAANGKTCFDCIGGQVSWTDAGDDFGHNQRPPPRTQTYGAEQCAAWMRNYCAPGMQGRGMFMDWDVRSNATNHEQTMAAFLITRPPYAFIGSYKLSPPFVSLPKLFTLDVGEPLGLCEEVKSGVFQRKWSKGTAALDCSTYVATLDFPTLQ